MAGDGRARSPKEKRGDALRVPESGFPVGAGIRNPKDVINAMAGDNRGSPSPNPEKAGDSHNCDKSSSSRLAPTSSKLFGIILDKGIFVQRPFGKYHLQRKGRVLWSRVAGGETITE